MSSKPLITIIISCYNYERYVAAAIESALEQEYAHKEVLVIDDGSTDRSLEIAEQYGVSVQLLTQPNQGQIVAFNTAYAASRGEIVVFLDADDLLHPTALSKIAQAWTPTCAKVQYDLTVVDGEGRNLGRRVCNFPKNYGAFAARDAFFRTGTYRWPVTTGNAYARTFLDQLFPLKIARAPDGHLNTIAPVYGDVITIAEPLGSYRVHGENLWSVRPGDEKRLPERISLRYEEVGSMLQHARKAGVSVPSTNVLDHELTFINYRLMARKLGLDYEASDRDSNAGLYVSALRLLAKEQLPGSAKALHLAWFSVLAVTPKRISEKLIQLRFDRSQLTPQRLARVLTG